MKRSFKISITTSYQNNMSVKSAKKLLLRRYTYDSMQKIYNKNTKPLPDVVQQKMNIIRKQLTDIHLESEKKPKRQYPKKNNGIHRRSIQNSVISRNLPTKLDNFSIFTKKYNLILNSLIETNIVDVSQRITKLILQQNILTDVDTQSSTEKERVEEYIKHIANQIVDNAVLQPIYSKCYVTVLHHLFQAMEQRNHSQFKKSVMNELKVSIQSIGCASLNNMNAKGYGKLVTQLYMHNILIKEQFDLFLQKWISCFSENENIICELFVHIFLTIAEENAYKVVWKEYVSTHLQPLWENDKVGMRAKIRMWDIRDKYQ